MKLNKTSVKIHRGVLFAGLLFFSAAASSSVVQNGSIKDFKFSSCTVESCVELRSDKATQTFLTGGFYFNSGTLVAYRKNSLALIKKLKVGDVYYDPRTQKIYVHEISGRNDVELYVDLIDTSFREFKK